MIRFVCQRTTQGGRMNRTDMMDEKQYFFAGGGTGGHIYPALAIAEQVTQKDDGSSMLFF
ncbi:MAG: glycosyltransferase, partial [Planctomycetota bacterium]